MHYCMGYMFSEHLVNKCDIHCQAQTSTLIWIHKCNFCLLFYLLCRKLRQSDATKFHIQLCIALSIMMIVFVSGINRTDNRLGCITVGVLIHYFSLVSCLWMGAEAVLMFQKLIVVFDQITWRYFLIISVFCWGKFDCSDIIFFILSNSVVLV